MTLRTRTSAVLASTLGLVVLSTLPIEAQEPSTKTVAARKQVRRVPDHFGQIGLTSEQRTNIYGIQTRRFEKIDALEKQIAQERSEMLSECEGILTETQKKLLENLRKAATETRAGTSRKPSDPPKTDEKPKPAN